MKMIVDGVETDMPQYMIDSFPKELPARDVLPAGEFRQRLGNKWGDFVAATPVPDLLRIFLAADGVDLKDVAVQKSLKAVSAVVVG
jgi:hypothetical protein